MKEEEKKEEKKNQNQSNPRGGQGRGRKPKHPSKKGTQGKKDSKDPRVNYDNERKSDFDKKFDRRDHNTDNDLRWYSKNPQLTASAGSLWMTSVLGEPVYDNLAIPGILTANIRPCFYEVEAMNTAFNSQFNFIVHANSRNTDYDPSDLGRFELATFNVFAIMSFAQRAYGIMKKYNGLNKYTPKALMNAMGLNYEDFQANLSNIWFDLNQLVAQTSSLWVPNNMPLAERWYWMYQNIYVDAQNSPKAQYYMFVPEYFWTFSSDTLSSDVSRIGLFPVTTGVNQTNDAIIFSPSQAAASGKYYTWQQLRDVISQMIRTIVDNPSRGTIMGDILKAYGANAIYALPEIPSNYEIMYSYNPEVQMEFENITVGNPWDPVDILYYYSNSGYTMYSGVTKPLKISSGGDIVYSDDIPTAYQSVGAPNKPILNLHFDNPSPEQLIAATRLTTAGNIIGWYRVQNGAGVWSNKKYVRPKTCGSERCTSVQYWYYNVTTNSAGEPVYVLAHANQDSHQTPSTSMNNTIWAHEAIDWSPILYQSTQYTPNIYEAIDVDAPYGQDISITTNRGLCDYDNYMQLTYDELHKMNVAALYSMFNVPII